MSRPPSLCIFAEDHDNELLSALSVHCCGHARFVRFWRVCAMHISRALVRAQKNGAQISTRRSQAAWTPIIQCDSRLCSDIFMIYERGPTCTMSCRSNHVYRLSSMFLGVLSQSSETMPPHARRSCVDQRQNCRIPLSVCEVGFNRNVCDGNNRVLNNYECT